MSEWTYKDKPRAEKVKWKKKKEQTIQHEKE